MSYDVLVVDDSPIIRAVVRKSLRMAGVDVGEVREAGDGREALREMEAKPVDIVFADINMPEMNGLQLLDRVRTDPLLRDVPVVVVSSERSQAVIDAINRFGARAYITKPFRPEDFKRVLSEILGDESPHTQQPPPLEPAVLADVLGAALEEAAFLLVEPGGERLAPEAERVTASVCFRGPLAGRIELTTSRDLAEAMAANLLGCEPEDEEAGEGAVAAVGEVLNIFAGMLLSRWFGEDVVTRLGIPELGEAADGPTADDTPPVHVALVAESEHRVDATVRLGAGCGCGADRREQSA